MVRTWVARADGGRCNTLAKGRHWQLDGGRATLCPSLSFPHSISYYQSIDLGTGNLEQNLRRQPVELQRLASTGPSCRC